MPLPSWMSPKQELRRQNRRSGAQERKRAIEQGGRTQPGSGSSWRARGDVVTPEYLESLKYTDHFTYRLDVREWWTHREQALQAGKEPRMVIDFVGATGTRLVVYEEPLT